MLTQPPNKTCIGQLIRLHGRVVKGVGHLGNDEAMEAGGRELGAL